MKQETKEVLDELRAEIAQLTEEVRQLKEQVTQHQPSTITHHYYTLPYVAPQPQLWPWQPINPLSPFWCGIDTKTELIGVINQS